MTFIYFCEKSGLTYRENIFYGIHLLISLLWESNKFMNLESEVLDIKNCAGNLEENISGTNGLFNRSASFIFVPVVVHKAFYFAMLDLAGQWFLIYI